MSFFRFSLTSAGLFLLVILCHLQGCQVESVPQVDGVEVTMTDENFEQEALASDKLVLVDFYADWCGPCRQMEPAVAYLSEQYEDRLKVGKVNIDENGQVASDYGIQAIPTFVLIRDGQEIDRLSATLSYSSLSSWVDRHLPQ